VDAQDFLAQLKTTGTRGSILRAIQKLIQQTSDELIFEEDGTHTCVTDPDDEPQGEDPDQLGEV